MIGQETDLSLCLSAQTDALRVVKIAAKATNLEPAGKREQRRSRIKLENEPLRLAAVELFSGLWGFLNAVFPSSTWIKPNPGYSVLACSLLQGGGP